MSDKSKVLTFLTQDPLKMDSTELVSMVTVMRESGVSGDRQFRDRSVLSNNMYNGYQWDAGTIEQL